MYALGSDMSTINYRATVHPGNGEEPYETLVPVAASASDLSALARGSPNAPQALHRLADKANIMLITSGLACSICNRGRRATRSESVPSYYPDSEVPPGPLIVDFCFCQTCSDSACVSAARGVEVAHVLGVEEHRLGLRVVHNLLELLLHLLRQLHVTAAEKVGMSPTPDLLRLGLRTPPVCM